jgi:hypothetical protein
LLTNKEAKMGHTAPFSDPDRYVALLEGVFT